LGDRGVAPLGASAATGYAKLMRRLRFRFGENRMRGFYWPGVAALLLIMVWVTGGPVRAETVILKAELKAPSEMPPSQSRDGLACRDLRRELESPELERHPFRADGRRDLSAFSRSG